MVPLLDAVKTVTKIIKRSLRSCIRKWKLIVLTPPGVLHPFFIIQKHTIFGIETLPFFRSYKMTKIKNQWAPKVNVILLHRALCFLWANFLFFPQKVISLANIPGQGTTHMSEARVCVYFFKNGILKRGKKAKGTCVQGGIILIYFQGLITNLLQLISLLCPQLLFFCHRFIFLWKSERHQGSPWKSSGVELVSQMPHYWSRLQAYLVVYVLHSNHLFCSNRLLLWKWF